MPSSYESDGWGRLLILDTGPIRELVLFHAVDEFGFEGLRREVQFIKDQHSYQRCSQFIKSFRGRMTSASVVAELHRWIRGTEQHGRSRLWGRVYEEFRNMGMDEEVVKLLDMDRDLVARWGPVDVSLLELARRHSSDNPLVLTIDFALQGECRKAGLGVKLIQEVTLMMR